jgi:hypothetical protein
VPTYLKTNSASGITPSKNRLFPGIFQQFVAGYAQGNRVPRHTCDFGSVRAANQPSNRVIGLFGINAGASRSN